MMIKRTLFSILTAYFCVYFVFGIQANSIEIHPTSSGDISDNVQIHLGPKGPPGPTGARGPVGPPGPSGNGSVPMEVVRGFTGEDIQVAIDSFKKPGELPIFHMVGEVFIPAGNYILTRPLNLRGLHGLVFRGEGLKTNISAQFPNAIDPNTGKNFQTYPILDCTSANRLHISNMTVGTAHAGPSGPGHWKASCAILLARSDAAETSGSHYLENVVVEGFFSLAPLANLASEVNTVTHCAFTNYFVPETPESGGYELIVTNGNYRNLVNSPYGGIGISTMLQITFFQCHFNAYQSQRTGKASNIMLHSFPDCTTGDIYFIGGGLGNDAQTYQNPIDAFASFYLYQQTVGNGGGLLKNIAIKNMRFETGGAKHAFYSSGNVSNVSIEQCSVQSKEEGIFLDNDRSSVGDWNIKETEMFNTAEYSWGQLTTKGLIRASVRTTYTRNMNVDFARSHFSKSTETGSTDPGPGGIFRWNRAVYCKGYSIGDQYSVISRDLLELPEMSIGTNVRAFYDNQVPGEPVGRVYIGAGTTSYPTLLNLPILKYDPTLPAGQFGGPPVHTVFKDGDVLFADTPTAPLRMYLMQNGSWNYINFN